MLTRKYSSRIRTSCTSILHASVVSHQMSALVGDCTVRSSREQVWAGVQSCLPDVTSRGQNPVQRGLRPCIGGCHIGRSNAPWEMVTWDPLSTWAEWQTETCEIITFLQLRWRAVIKPHRQDFPPNLSTASNSTLTIPKNIVEESFVYLGLHRVIS